MKKRNVLAGLMAAVMAAGMLAGCGGSGDSTESGEKKEAPSAVVESTGEDVTLKVVLWDYSNVTYFKTIIDAFEKENPNIKVEIVELAADEYDNVVTVQLSGKQDFDVVFTKGTPALSALIEQGHIYALDEYLKTEGDFNADNYNGLVDQLSLDGHTYALPFRYDNNLIFYNKDLFDKAGVDYPQDGMTMAEYRELAEKMTSGEGNDKVYGTHVHTWPSNVYQYPNRTGMFKFDDPTTYENLIPYYNEILSMQDEGVIQDYGALKSSNIHYSGVFYNQQAAMLQMGTWYINMLCENSKDFNWGVCTLPNNDGIANENCVGGVTPVSIGAYAKHPAEAWKFITYVCGEEGAKVLASCGIVPGYSSDAVGEIFDSLHDTYPTAPEGLSKYIVNLEKNYMEQPMNAKNKEIDTIFNEAHSAIMTKSVTPEEGVADLAERVNGVLAEE